MRAAGLGAAGIVLAWLVISRSLVASLAGGAPEAALWLHPGDPQALLSLAEGRLDPKNLAKNSGESVPQTPAATSQTPRSHSPDPGTHEQIRIWAETALVNGPINARAFRILGQLAQASGDKRGAAIYMRAAARQSIHESTAVAWLMQDSFDKKDYDSALYFADALLRTRSQAMPHVLPILSRMAEDPEAAGKLQTILAGNPPWRRSFLSALPWAVSDARTPLRLVLAIRETPTPPALADVRNYVNVLIDHKFYELAYYTWLQFLPREHLTRAGLLFNGSFELAPSGLPFDWIVGAGTGVTADIAPRPDAAGQRALFIELGPGRVEFPGVTETLLLAPGAYRFKGKYRGEVTGKRGLVWRVTCAGTAWPPIGQSAMMVGVATDWKDVEFTFTVPETECRAQQLRLVLDARSPSEQLVSGTVWYDELGVFRAN